MPIHEKSTICVNQEHAAWKLGGNQTPVNPSELLSTDQLWTPHVTAPQRQTPNGYATLCGVLQCPTEKFKIWAVKNCDHGTPPFSPDQDPTKCPNEAQMKRRRRARSRAVAGQTRWTSTRSPTIWASLRTNSRTSSRAKTRSSRLVSMADQTPSARPRKRVRGPILSRI